ncbi:class B sortase [Paratractidigestivibacter sp.]|uniref:class B sortase n=1 Tax=Paratractidigestivibacter sp. TaxID=2847316 RepID=UPI002ABE8A39|nr:class B sortase [Paratractidigestivibacter sp.]
MAKHFKETDADQSAATAHIAASSPVRSTSDSDESYNAPAGNRHASTNNQAVGYRSVISKSGEDRGGKENRRRARIISTILLVVGIGLLLAAGGMWLYNQYQYKQQDTINEKLATYAKVDDAGSSAPVVDWDALKAVNPDVVGWIQIPGTVVNYPVYQGSDNDEYLRTNAEGNYSVGGQIFLDAENTKPGMLDQQTIIYGHHLYNGSMFKTVADMENQGMFDSVNTIWYVTEDATYELQPVLTYKTDENDENIRIFSFNSTEEYQSYLSGLEAKACAKASNASELLANNTKVLSLCTCSYTDNEYGRVILVCVPK